MISLSLDEVMSWMAGCSSAERFRDGSVRGRPQAGLSAKNGTDFVARRTSHAIGWIVGDCASGDPLW
jgi:hypothetical protein